MDNIDQQIPSALEAFRLINILEGIRNITTYDRALNSTTEGRKVIRDDQIAIDTIRFMLHPTLTEIMTKLNTALVSHNNLSDEAILELASPLSLRSAQLIIHQLQRYLKPDTNVSEEGHDVYEKVLASEM